MQASTTLAATAAACASDATVITHIQRFALLSGSFPLNYLPCISGGVEALATVMGPDSEPVLAGAAMQALTTLAGHVSARLAVLRDSSLLATIAKCLRPGGASVSVYYRQPTPNVYSCTPRLVYAVLVLSYHAALMNFACPGALLLAAELPWMLLELTCRPLPMIKQYQHFNISHQACWEGIWPFCFCA